MNEFSLFPLFCAQDTSCMILAVFVMVGEEVQISIGMGGPRYTSMIRAL